MFVQGLTTLFLSWALTSSNGQLTIPVLDLSVSLNIDFCQSLPNIKLFGLCSQCRPGWLAFNGSCYAFREVGKPWNQASAGCRFNNAYLVEIDNLAEHNFVTELAASRNATAIWTGATEELSRNTFVQGNSGRRVVYTNWAAGQPSDFNGIVQDCVAITQANNWLWSDESCASSYSSICEVPPDPCLPVDGECPDVI